jgi:meso-butanediol dehydrogenase/(S,S)-butanediol dehydrogenase/diacetyl reductase
MRLKDRIVVVTGGGGGIGKGICSCLAREGADIVVCDLNEEAAKTTVAAIEAKGRSSFAVAADITDETACQNLVVAATERFGRIDVLVNNAGHFGASIGQHFTDQTAEDWEANFAVNLTGPFYLCKAVAPGMIERKFGKIINISSIAAQRDPSFAPAYAAAKNGLLNLTRVVAKDLGPHNVNVNAICPGLLWTDFWNRMAPMMAATNPVFAGLEPRQVFEKMVEQNTPLGREQVPEDIGNMVVFLASEEARNITGQSINVDGGISMR